MIQGNMWFDSGWILHNVTACLKQPSGIVIMILLGVHLQ